MSESATHPAASGAGTEPAPPPDMAAEEEATSSLMSPSCALEAIGELSELGTGLQAAFEEQPDSDWELDDYERLDLGDILLQTSLREEVRIALDRFLQRHLSPGRVLLRDKLTFVLGTLHMAVCFYWLGCSPHTFYRLYTCEAAALLVLRLAHYRWSHQHYYMLDWCYVANALLVAHVWLWPTNILLAKVTFAHSMGPLLWSILAFRNSIVFHSLDKMTSHFLHWFPACVCWASRWHTGGVLEQHLRSTPAAAAARQWEGQLLRDLVLLPLLPYLAWALLYYLKVFVVSSRKIQQRNYDTLYTFVTSSRRSLFGAVVLRAPPKLRPAVYMSAHLLLTLATLLLSCVWWRYRWANAAFMAAIFTASAWAGGTYYFDVFAHRYLASLGIDPKGARLERDTSHTQAQAAAAAGLEVSTTSDTKKNT